MNSIPKVLNIVVKNDLCIGCGLCIYKCPEKAIEMNWNEFGFLIPKLTGACDTKGACISVCPFNPFPDKEVETENEIADIYLKESELYHQKLGKYINIYAGYSKEFRLTSSSGGIATYIFKELIEKKIVNHIFSVKQSTKSNSDFEYAIISSKDDLLSTSKTKYYPVTLATVFQNIHKLNGKVAIVGIACFIKAIRLAQYHEPILKEKIPFLIGIICGGLKSRFFTEYLANKADIKVQNIKTPQYRIKDLNSTAGDYSFGCINNSDNIERTIRMRSVGDMWGTGLFKANACDFCDDVTTELADISLGDAWVHPYRNDGFGTNVIVTRSTLADRIIKDGILKNEIKIDYINEEELISSQRGNYNHRQKGLKFRINISKFQKKVVPPKRNLSKGIYLDFAVVQLIRSITRKASLEIWKNTLDANEFDKKIYWKLKQLHYSTRIYHYRRSFVKKINVLLDK